MWSPIQEFVPTVTETLEVKEHMEEMFQQILEDEQQFLMHFIVCKLFLIKVDLK